MSKTKRLKAKKLLLIDSSLNISIQKKFGKPMEEDFEETLKNEFLMEASELAENCEDAFIELEKDPTNSEIIDEIFRIAHTFKGGALTVGFEDLGQFSHVFENVLMKIREKKIDPTPAVIDVLLEGNDILSKFITVLREDFNGEVDTKSTKAKLLECLGEDPSDKKEPVVSDLLSDGFGFFDDDEEDDVILTPPSSTQKTASTKITSIEKDNIFENLTVLICDDDKDILDILTDIIEDMGIKVVATDSALKAIDIFQSTHIDTILTDLKMPDLNGIQLIKKIREINKDIPVIFCSGYADRDDLVKFIELGVHGFIDKPFDQVKIQSMIKHALVLNALKRGIKNLSALNFNAYMTMVKILRAIEDGKMNEIAPLKPILEKKMDEISSFTGKLLAFNKSS